MGLRDPRSRDVPPELSVLDGAHHYIGYSETSPKGGARFPNGETRPDLTHGFLGQFGASVLGTLKETRMQTRAALVSSRQSLGVHCGPTLVSQGKSPLREHVVRVVFHGSKEQMRDPDTSRVVAAVTNEKALRDRPEGEHPSEPMRADGAPTSVGARADLEEAVSIFVLPSHEHVALSKLGTVGLDRTARVDASGKPFRVCYSLESHRSTSSALLVRGVAGVHALATRPDLTTSRFCRRSPIGLA
jgi:hypothetical protein